MFEDSIDLIGILEVLLCVIIETCKSADIPNRMHNNPIDTESDDKASKENENIFAENGIVKSCSCQLSWGLLRLVR